MKISGASISAAKETARIYQSQTNSPAKVQRGGANRRFDSVMISNGDGRRGSFEMELRGRISREVRTSTSSGQVAALREQVRSGAYRIDAKEIAQKMLLLEEAG